MKKRTKRESEREKREQRGVRGKQRGEKSRKEHYLATALHTAYLLSAHSAQRTAH